MLHKNHHSALILIFLISFCQKYVAQPYAPPVGHSGTTAMYKDSSAFVNWASECRVLRGYQDISTPTLGVASVGDSSMVTGLPDLAVVSLGDGGTATCTFPFFITNGPGPDLAVFENSFDDTFLELAFVEVSSDGIHFFRFASRSLTDTTIQTASFGPTDATKLNNLAGKYRGNYGTPFDLQELAGTAGLNINAVSHVRIIDVVGSINKQYATRDSYGSIVNDPWPTAFPSGGFDLDAVGVIHQSTLTALPEYRLEAEITLYPNPAEKNNVVTIQSSQQVETVEVSDLTGNTLLQTGNTIDVALLPAGLYLVRIKTASGILIKKLVVSE